MEPPPPQLYSKPSFYRHWCIQDPSSYRRHPSSFGPLYASRAGNIPKTSPDPLIRPPSSPTRCQRRPQRKKKKIGKELSQFPKRGPSFSSAPPPFPLPTVFPFWKMRGRNFLIPHLSLSPLFLFSLSPILCQPKET